MLSHHMHIVQGGDDDDGVDNVPALSDDSTILAIGVPSYSANRVNTGPVHVYSWYGNMWTKVCNDIIAKRTRKGLSTTVESKMNGETHANYFKDYFRVYNYVDQIVTDALDSTATSMTNVNVDFIAINFDGR